MKQQEKKLIVNLIKIVIYIMFIIFGIPTDIIGLIGIIYTLVIKYYNK